MRPKPNNEDSLTVYTTVFSFEDVSKTVDTFYRKVARHPVLSKPFQSVKDWDHHIESITQFWWLRFGGDAYLEDVGFNPIQKHFEAGFTREFLKIWTELFRESLEMHLNAEQTEVWIQLVNRMGDFLAGRNDLMNEKFAHLQPED